jgi:hypothetical protein
MLSPCSPIPPPRPATVLSSPVHRVKHAVHRVWHHAAHRSMLHAAVHPVRLVRTACNSLPQWLVHAAVTLPVVVSLHAATPGQHAPSGLQTAPSSIPDADSAVPDAGSSQEGPVAIPTVSVVPPDTLGSQILSFAPTVASPPPNPQTVLGPHIVKPQGGSPGGSGPSNSQSGGPSGGQQTTVTTSSVTDVPPTVITTTGSQQALPIPEPPSWLVLALPAVALVGAKRQRRTAMA